MTRSPTVVHRVGFLATCEQMPRLDVVTLVGRLDAARQTELTAVAVTCQHRETQLLPCRSRCVSTPITAGSRNLAVINTAVGPGFRPVRTPSDRAHLVSSGHQDTRTLVQLDRSPSCRSRRRRPTCAHRRAGTGRADRGRPGSGGSGRRPGRSGSPGHRRWDRVLDAHPARRPRTVYCALQELLAARRVQHVADGVRDDVGPASDVDGQRGASTPPPRMLSTRQQRSQTSASRP
jgi:hypothetical protein